jgi:phosphatidylglycerol:prolipoprotein diacylglycerol transferase
VIFGAGYLVYWAKKSGYNVMAVLDAVAPGMLVGHAIGRVGCFLNGCCYGGQCPPNMPLALHIEGLSYTVHPAQLYDAAMNLVAFGFLIWRERRGLSVGQVSGLFLMLHGLARFIYEYWRIGETAEHLGSLPISEAQGVAAVMFVIGAWIYVRASRFRGATQEVGLVQ